MCFYWLPIIDLFATNQMLSCNVALYLQNVFKITYPNEWEKYLH